MKTEKQNDSTLADRLSELESRIFYLSGRLSSIEVQPQGTDFYLLMFAFFGGIVIGRQIQRLFEEEPETKRK